MPHMPTTIRTAAAVLAVLAPVLSVQAQAQVSDGVVKIGVLTDQSGMYADAAGPGSVEAARMAVQDFGGSVLGQPIQVIAGDTQNKPDIAAALANSWFDTQQVDAIADMPVSSVALAIQEIGRSKKKVLLFSGGATSDLTGRACSPYSSQWADDTYSLAVATARAVVENGGRDWYFLTADYAFGQAMERDASEMVKRAGGRVLGSVRHPLGAPDFSSFLLQAQGSKAAIIGLASVGADPANAIKQAAEFGMASGGQSLAAFLMFITDIHGLGLKVAQGLLVSEGFYWDQNDAARDWSKRFSAKFNRMPTKEQAATYAAVLHYLKAVREAGTDEAGAVSAAMRRLPTDFFGRIGSLRADGRVMTDLTLYKVKTPSESKGPWDYYTSVRTIPAEAAYRPLGEGGCSSVSAN